MIRLHVIVATFAVATAFHGLAETAAKPTAEALYASAQSAQQKGDLQSAIASYRELIRLYPRTAPAYNNLGSLYYDTGDFKEAIRITEAGLRLDHSMASSYAILGAAYRAVGDNKEAIAELKIAVAKNPKDDRAQQQLIRALIDVQDYPAAAEYLRQQTERDPDNQDAWRQLGDVYLLLSQQAHAKVFAIDAHSATALDLSGEIQEAMGNYAAAQTKYEEAERVAPDKPGTHEHLGNIYWVQGSWQKAETEFRSELVNEPTSCHVQWKLGNCLLNEQADPAQALQVLSAAIQTCPGLMQAHVDRASVLIRLNRAPEALDDLLLAERETPDEPTIHFLLAKVYRAADRPADAARETQTFTRLVDKTKANATGSQVSK